MRIEINCCYCTKPTIAKNRRRQFCSQKCRDAARYIKKPGKSVTTKWFPCAYCGDQVRTIKAKQNVRKRFCNRDHMIAYLKAQAFRTNCVICNKEMQIQPAQIKYRNRSTCSRKCMAVLRRKKRDERWLRNPPTIGQLNRRIRYSIDMKKWRQLVFVRDDYTCTTCGKRGGYLEADHIKPFALFPGLRFDVSNGRTLCRPCHQNTETWGRREIYFEDKVFPIEKSI